MFRLKLKHSRIVSDRLPPADGRRLLAEQSLLRGLVGSVAVGLLLCWLWALLATRTGSIYPWFSLLLGAMIGVAMQRFGRGLNWRFPVVAAIVAGVAAYAGNLMIGVLETGRYIEATPLSVVGGLSIDTMKNFFHITISPIDHIYAFCASGVAAFLANRRLRRHEVLGLRTIKSFDKENA
jgi:hypothetical protein